MNNRISISFLILILVQALHSVEEYLGRLWEVLPPARFMSGLLSKNLETGFILINLILFVFGMWCWRFPVCKNYLIKPIILWFWIIVELINGIAHPAWVLYERAYVPGLLTAPLLFIVAIYLSRQLTSRIH